MLSILFKVYGTILEKTLVEIQLEELQSEFRKKRKEQNHTFTIKLVEKNAYSNIFEAFLNIEKIFDSIPRKIVWNYLEKGESMKDC